ncbi:MAG: F0F1 ATP synthase subunit A [Bacillota bacterium]|nr:F0F1 ATP synthase subunit A [Bacillota bacterium]
MHSTEHLGPRKIIGLFDGSFFITETVLFSLIASAVLIIAALLVTRNLKTVPTGAQIWAELIVSSMYKLVENIMGKHNIAFAPYIGTLMTYLVLANAFGLFGFRPITADVNVAFALGLITFMLIQGNSFRSKGAKGYVKHFGEPYPFMYPIKIIEDLAFPISLSCRLFGNITGGMIVMALAFTALDSFSHSLHLPIPLLAVAIPLPLNLFFDVFEPVLQAFIFTMLTMVFVTMAITAHGGEEH